MEKNSNHKDDLVRFWITVYHTINKRRVPKLDSKGYLKLKQRIRILMDAAGLNKTDFKNLVYYALQCDPLRLGGPEHYSSIEVIARSLSSFNTWRGSFAHELREASELEVLQKYADSIGRSSNVDKLFEGMYD